jgi:hypothetical protein
VIATRSPVFTSQGTLWEAKGQRFYPMFWGPIPGNGSLDDCDVDDDGLVALVSSLERDETLEHLSLKGNHFSKSGFLALAASLPRIKVLEGITFTWNTSFEAVLPVLMEGFRKNTSLLEVNIDGAEPGKFGLRKLVCFVSGTGSFL